MHAKGFAMDDLGFHAGPLSLDGSICLAAIITRKVLGFYPV